jgi:hypothetical protein
MDNTTNALKDLAASNDTFITSVYSTIAKRIWNSRLIKADYQSDIKGIDYISSKGTIQFKELKSDANRSYYDSDRLPFETASKNCNGQWQAGWIYHTEADYLVFIRTIRDTGEWRAVIYDWNKMKSYILENIDESYNNKFGSARNQSFYKEELKEYCIADISS